MVLEYEPYRRRFTSVKVDGKYYPFDRRKFVIPDGKKFKGFRSERQVLRAVSKLNRMI